MLGVRLRGVGERVYIFFRSRVVMIGTWLV